LHRSVAHHLSRILVRIPFAKEVCTDAAPEKQESEDQDREEDHIQRVLVLRILHMVAIVALLLIQVALGVALGVGFRGNMLSSVSTTGINNWNNYSCLPILLLSSQSLNVPFVTRVFHFLTYELLLEGTTYRLALISFRCLANFGVQILGLGTAQKVFNTFIMLITIIAKRFRCRLQAILTCFLARLVTTA